jgi:multicomponent Na+:H+ antiporter subunit D
MSLATILVPLVVAIPLLGSAITLALGRRTVTQIAVGVASLATVALISATLLVLVDQQGPPSCTSAAGRRRGGSCSSSIGSPR